MKCFTIIGSRLVFSSSIVIIIIELLILSGFAVHAVPIQLLFPESPEVTTTNPNSNATSSGRLCEKYQYYYNETGSCWPTKPRQQGPCPDSMILYPVDKIYCDCDCPEVNHSTVYVYDVSSNQCFKTYQQAFCSTKEWLILDNNSSIPICVPNNCQKQIGSGTFKENEEHPVVLLKNKCVRLLQSDPDVCASPHEITIDPDKGIPMCSSDLPLTQEYDLGVKGSFKCRAGTRRDRLGKCRPTNTKDITE